MRSEVHFVSTPTADTRGTSLLLHFDKKRYLIGNVSEGTQRAAVQRGFKLLRVSNIFLTGKTEWANTGGLIGMILSLADASTTAAIAAEEAKGKKATKGAEDGIENHLTVHGGENLNHTMATARRFVFRQGMPVTLNEYSDRSERQNKNNGKLEPSWSDENILVWAMPISPELDTKSRSRSGTRSPSKRSFDEMANAIDINGANVSESAEEKRDREDQMRKSIVSEMFDSSWRLDALVEVPLSEVRLPAAIFVRNKDTKSLEKYDGPLPGGNAELPDIQVLVRTPWPGAMITKLPPTQPSTQAVSYIIRNHYQRGKFLPQKAKELKVEIPQYRVLAAGKSVTLSDGKVVTPEMVLEEGKPGSGFAVVELPSIEYVASLIGREEWTAREVMKGVGAVVWILGPGVGSDERLRKFMSDHSNLKHIVSSGDYCTNSIAFTSAAGSSIQLGLIDPIRFPVPVHDNDTLPQAGWGSSSDVLPPGPLFTEAKAGLKIQLEPAFEVQEQEAAPLFNPIPLLKSTPQNILRLAQQARDEVASKEFLEELAEKQIDLPSQDAEIITLGTGSALPSKYRNVSATLLRVPGYGSYLLDCGENTLGQLKRVFKPSELKEVLRDLKMIWISHLHADHHLGTVSVIKAWYQEHYGQRSAESGSEEKKRLFVVSDRAMINWLDEYASVESYGHDKLMAMSVENAVPSKEKRSTLTWKDNEPIALVEDGKDDALGSLFKSATGLSDIQSVAVQHCAGAKAVSLTFPNGFKFSYSGDCRPCNNFAIIGKDSTVVLHEATFDDELHGDALAKKHSTTSEALGVAAKMRAKRVILTHFSQRYQRIPVMINAEGEDDAGNAQNVVEVGEAQADSDTTMADAYDGPIENPTGPPPASSLTGPEPPSNATTNNDDDNANAPPPSSSAPSAPAIVQFKKPPSIDMKVGIAFDYMRVRVGEIAHLERFTPVLSAYFEEKTREEARAKEASKAAAAEKGREAELAKAAKARLRDEKRAEEVRAMREKKEREKGEKGEKGGMAGKEKTRKGKGKGQANKREEFKTQELGERGTKKEEDEKGSS
ncbi:MAG: hypothetical protein M1819_005917 [Sarea resinae]|nr:MAG: hypothetical protein M1819_005917 [Sarea resinae]